jgi:SAM-dependent methyltransferase
VDQSEFDAFADEYRHLHSSNIKASGETPEYFANQKAQMAARLVGRLLPNNLILDFGAGVGNSIGPLTRYFPSPRITAIDVSRKSLDIASARFGNSAQFLHYDGKRIPLEDGQFGLVFVACVFHHIDHSEHVALLRDIRRVLTPGGRLVIFEHNPLNPLTVHAVKTCEFDRNARLIRAGVFRDVMRVAGFDEVRVHYSIFFPRALRFARPLEHSMRWIPLGAQYCVTGQR